MGFFFNEDLRIHVNLSDYAWSVLRDDMFNFSRDDVGNVSGFINDIILNFYAEANASVAARCDEIASHYEQMLSENSLKIKMDPSVLYSVIDVATASFKTRTFNEINGYGKDAYKKIKLRKAVAEMLADSQESEYYNGNLGNYIKAIIEEYARLPFLRREEIIKKENFELISKAIAAHRRIRIAVRSGKTFEVIPYKIASDKLSLFNYLVGIDATTKQPVAYRIAKVKIKVLSRLGKIDASAEELINRKLHTSDVLFLSNDSIRVVIRLNQYGVQKYNSQLHMRPEYIEKLENDRYVFQCSADQIKYYFIKFGSSAVIEEPAELAEYFRKFYRYALAAYGPAAETEI